jgi:hypothetical protein
MKPELARTTARTSRRGGAREHATRRPGARLVAPALAALALAGCGSAVKVQPSTPSGSSKLVSRGLVDSPLTDTRDHLACIQKAHLPVQVVSPIKLQVGTSPSGPTIVFASTPGAAQADQIAGTVQAAEVIGSALLYPNQASDAELASIEGCLAQGVQG